MVLLGVGLLSEFVLFDCGCLVFGDFYGLYLLQLFVGILRFGCLNGFVGLCFCVRMFVCFGECVN